MQTYLKKRLEIIIEAPLMRKVVEQLDRAAVTGYTVLPVVAGRGGQGSWSADKQISYQGGMFAIVSILDPSRVDDVLEAVFAVVTRQIGIVALSDVQVVRSDRF